MKRLTSYILHLTSAILLVARGPSVPTNYTQSDKLPAIYPDYAQVTIPVNMAPLSFEFDGEADEMVARYAVGDDDIVCNGQPDIDKWHSLAEKAKGKSEQSKAERPYSTMAGQSQSLSGFSMPAMSRTF